jgi:hypothetical protein
MARNRNRRILCVYCGRSPATTKDHVVPRCLFDGRIPSIMVTVPVCRPCNEEKGRDDDYLCDLRAIDIDNSGNTAAQALLHGRVARAARTNRSQVARDIRTKSKMTAVRTMGGVYLGHSPSIPIDTARFVRQLSRIARGLYFKVSKRALLVDCDFKVQRVDRFRVGMAVQALQNMGVTKCRRLGDDVFGCMFAIAAEDPAVTHWPQWYFNVFFTVTTNLSKHPELLGVAKDVAS